jgi:hypothetical protein
MLPCRASVGAAKVSARVDARTRRREWRDGAVAHSGELTLEESRRRRNSVEVLQRNAQAPAAKGRMGGAAAELDAACRVRPYDPTLAGKTMEFDGSGKCVAGCP